MPLFEVDETRCRRDGICVAVCPVSIIEFKERGAVPSPVAGAEERCIACGHCVAACPHGALSHSAMKPEACPPLRKDWIPAPDQVEHFFRSRRSIRTFAPGPVDPGLLRRAIDMARYAPSGHNRQPVEWMVLRDGGDVRVMAELVADWMRHLIEDKPQFAQQLNLDRVVAAFEAGRDVICRDAPHLVIAHARKTDRTAPFACTIALTHLDLAIHALGLGACWAGYFTAAAGMWPPLQNALDLPPGNVCFGTLMVGCPEYGYHRLPLRKEPPIIWR